MRFNFSLKWLLVATAYVALAVAACRHQTTLLTDLLLLASGGIWLAALLFALLWSGRARAIALGFVLWSTAFTQIFWLQPMLGAATDDSMARRVTPWERFFRPHAIRSYFGATANARRIHSMRFDCNMYSCTHAIAAIGYGLVGSLSAMFIYSLREKAEQKRAHQQLAHANDE